MDWAGLGAVAEMKWRGVSTAFFPPGEGGCAYWYWLVRMDGR